MQLIDRYALLKNVYDNPPEKATMTHAEWCRKCIYEAPTIEAEPVRHGRWIECDYKHMEHGMIETEPKAGLCCSECRAAFQKKKMTYKQYCAACGARMDAPDTNVDGKGGGAGMDTGRNILSDDKAKALREIIEQEEAGRVYVIPARGNCKTAAMKAALERAMKAALERATEQARQIKQHLTETRLAPSTEELLEGVRLPEMPKPSRATRGTYDILCEATRDAYDILREAKLHNTMRRIGEQAAQYQREIESTKREAELAKKRAPIIAVDFDGTLCENAWPDIGETKWETVQALIAAQAAGARLILWTNRVGARLTEAIEWARNRELEFDAVNENLPEVLAAFVTDCRKVYADIYLDDKAAQPSAAVLGQLWETARATMNEAAKKKEEKPE